MPRAAISPPRSIAERARAHRAAFLLAQELRCTPAEAAEEIARREAATRNAEAQARLRARMNGTATDPQPEPRDQPWMLRD